MKKSICFLMLFLTIFGAHSQTISTIAGVDTTGFSGDGGPATMAELYGPISVVADALHLQGHKILCPQLLKFIMFLEKKC